MKRITKLLSICCLSFMMLIATTSCGSTKSTIGSEKITNSKKTTTVDGMKKYVIQLSVDNYKTYFNVIHQSKLNPAVSPKLSFSGCIYNGIYENCVVTYKYSISSGAEPSIEKSFSLNMGGNGEVIIEGFNSVITNITGTVTYWK